ncbi:hypothetical protein A9Q95_14740 [Rhodobacterales bacterium 59_46_T64]|nr:hypothetical protein A9Q95_14740 [Rhodobacterales bacterium 59_46_T64]
MIRITKILSRVAGIWQKEPVSQLVPARVNGSRTAIVFLHGFTGAADSTWSSFSEQLLSDQELEDWDVFQLGFPSRFSLDLPIWKSDPGILLCSRGLITKLNSNSLKGYDCLALVAHSLGGLVAQRAILDSDSFNKRLSHLALFGTPSAGSRKAGFGRLLKYQLRDMAHDGEFIRSLRADWNSQIGLNPSFEFKTIAGDQDAFVPSESSILPFDSRFQEAVSGNHLEIVRPSSKEDFSYSLVKSLLQGNVAPHSVLETSRLAIEKKDFLTAIELLLPNALELDEGAIVALALALESVGRSTDAMQAIEVWSADKPNLDAKGVLAGRLKRRWLVERKQKDFDRSLALYSHGRDDAITKSDHAQAYYHAINVSFLLLAYSRVEDPVPQESIDAAKVALKHVELAPPSAWSKATKGEANLICGELESAITLYEEACKEAMTVRDRHSMYVQAVTVAARVYGQDARQRIDAAFGIVKSQSISKI